MASLSALASVDGGVLRAHSWTIEGRQELDATTAAEASAVIELFISELRSSYGLHAAVDLVGWLQRNEVDWAARERNWACWRWLEAVHGRRLALNLQSPIAEVILAVASTAVDSDRSAAYRGLELQARQAELEPTEQALLQRWVEPGGPFTAFDVIGALGLARTREIAFAASIVIRAAASEAEWNQVARRMRT